MTISFERMGRPETCVVAAVGLFTIFCFSEQK